MPTVTQVALGAWTDFSVQTKQLTGTLSQSIAVGHRVFLVLASTVSANVAPGAATWGGIVTLYDNQGNVFTRDTPTAAIAATNGTTAEIWSAYVHYAIPTTGYALNVTPDSRGLSAYWRLIDVAGLAESSNGAVSPLDQVAQADETSTTTFVSGTTATLSTADTWCLAIFGVAGAPAAPWATDGNGFTRIGSDDSGVAPGSSRGLSVWQKEVFVTTGISQTVTLASGFSGSGVIAAYKVAASSPATPGIRPVVNAEAQTAGATSQGVTLNTTGCDLLVVAASVWKTGGADPGATIADNKTNTWHLVPVTAPSTAGGARQYIWYAWNAIVGSGHTVTVTANASAEITASVNGFSGSQTTSDPLDQKNTNTGTSASATPGSVTVATDGELYFVAVTEDAGDTSINTSGWVQPDDVATNQDLHTQWQVAAHQTVNPTMTLLTSTTFAGVIGTFKAAVGSFVRPKIFVSREAHRRSTRW